MTDSRFHFCLGYSAFLCLQTLFLCQAHELRYKDESFPSEFEVFKRTVRCGNITPGLFPSKTWTCANITVNDHHVAYGYNFGSLGTGNCNETGGKHEFPALCREMLAMLGIDSDFWAVYIPKASCNKDRNKRAILTKDKYGFSWRDMGPGYGYIHTIQCMIKP